MGNSTLEQELNSVIGDRLSELYSTPSGTEKESKILDCLERLYKFKSMIQVNQVNYIIRKED